MYCIECGKANPDAAKFCAFCGAKLLTPASPTEGKAAAKPALSAGEGAAFAKPARAEKQEAAAAAEPRRSRAKAEEQVFDAPVARADALSGDEAPRAKTPEPRARKIEPPIRRSEPMITESTYRTLRPAIDNPAQPNRQGAAKIPKPKPISDEDFFPEEQAADIAPAKPILPGKSPLERRAEKNLVLTSSGTEELPARKPPVSREKRETFVPERIPIPREDVERRKPARDTERAPKLEEDDVFFVKPKKPAPKRRSEPEEDDIDDEYVNHRVRTILLSIAFVACLSVCFWLFATNSGQVFLAGFGMSQSADAYRSLGDEAYANNQIKRAAEAYYQALALDADDYETALKVGVTQQQIGNYDKAESAYYMCTQLKPAEIEPYRYLVKLYTAQGEMEKAEYFRSMGMQNTGVNPGE